MNQIFSFPRFRLMLRWELATKGQSYLVTAVPMLIFMLLLMLPFVFATEYNVVLPNLKYVALFLPLLVGGSLYTNQAFSQYSTRNTGMAALMVPASRFEKVASALLLNVLFWVPLLLLFLFLHNWCIDFANSRLPAGSQKYDKINPEILEPLVVFFILFQGFLFLGSLYFTKASFIKSLAIFIVLLWGLTYVNIKFAYYLVDESYWVGTMPFSDWRISLPQSRDFQMIQHSPLFQDLRNVLPLLFLMALWYITCVRLGEKEI